MPCFLVDGLLEMTFFSGLARKLPPGLQNLDVRGSPPSTRTEEALPLKEDSGNVVNDLATLRLCIYHRVRSAPPQECLLKACGEELGYENGIPFTHSSPDIAIKELHVVLITASVGGFYFFPVCQSHFQVP